MNGHFTAATPYVYAAAVMLLLALLAFVGAGVGLWHHQVITIGVSVVAALGCTIGSLTAITGALWSDVRSHQTPLWAWADDADRVRLSADLQEIPLDRRSNVRSVTVFRRPASADEA